MDTSESITNSVNSDKAVANENEIDSDISELLAENPSLLGGDDVTELLQRLSSADSMTQEMESKIDSVLHDLDELLTLLGAEEIPTTSEAANSTSVPDTKTSSDSTVD